MYGNPVLQTPNFSILYPVASGDTAEKLLAKDNGYFWQ